MPEFRALAEGMECAGAVIAPFVEAFPEDLRNIAVEILEKHGIHDLSPSRWYSLQGYYDAMKEIHDRFGTDLLHKIGVQMGLTAPFPPDTSTLEAALEVGSAVYQTVVKGGPFGHITVTEQETKSSMKQVKIEVTTGACCAYEWGLIEGCAQRFKPPGLQDFIVRHDETRPCRKHGADSCTYIASWM